MHVKGSIRPINSWGWHGDTALRPQLAGPSHRVRLRSRRNGVDECPAGIGELT
jgi:hypothetical protein